MERLVRSQPPFYNRQRASGRVTVPSSSRIKLRWSQRIVGPTPPLPLSENTVHRRLLATTRFARPYFLSPVNFVSLVSKSCITVRRKDEGNSSVRRWIESTTSRSFASLDDGRVGDKRGSAMIPFTKWDFNFVSWFVGFVLRANDVWWRVNIFFLILEIKLILRGG